MTEQRRNDFCACLSGRKFKNCCGRGRIPEAELTTQSLLEEARRAASQRNVAATEIWFRRILAIEPGNAEALAGLGQALCWQRKVREGVGFLKKAAIQLQLEPNRSGNLLDLAEQLQRWGEVAESVRLASFVVESAPESAAARNHLAQYLSRMNRLEEALPHARFALEKLPAHPGAALQLAHLERRLGLLDTARERLQKLVRHCREADTLARAWSELGTVMDGLGKFDEAFECFANAGAIQLESNRISKIDPSKIFQRISLNKKGFDASLFSKFSDHSNAICRSPVFLVGFFRSGTTLLEQILAAHSSVITSDENGILFEISREIGRFTDCGDDISQGLRKLEPKQMDYLRGTYWARVVEEYGTIDPDKLFVDKVTLNSISVGLIRCLFPQAKILFMVRDPRDVCVSCFAQSMRPTVTTINLLRWERIADQYAAVMDLWFSLRGFLGGVSLEIKYEALVENFEPTVRRVFEFIGIQWEASVNQFHEKSKQRFIATPSFADVTKPLFRSSIQRWRNYVAPIREIEALLERFIREYGYPAD